MNPVKEKENHENQNKNPLYSKVVPEGWAATVTAQPSKNDFTLQGAYQFSEQGFLCIGYIFPLLNVQVFLCFTKISDLQGFPCIGFSFFMFQLQGFPCFNNIFFLFWLYYFPVL